MSEQQEPGLDAEQRHRFRNFALTIAVMFIGIGLSASPTSCST